MRVILIGSGNIVYYLTRQFVAKGENVTLIANGMEAKVLARRLHATVLEGDGSDPALLEAAGARRAEVVLALTEKDQDNLAICQIAARMFQVPRTIALVHDPENEEVFRTLGVTVAFSPTQVVARILEERAGFEEIANIIPVADGRITVSEVALRPEAPAVEQDLEHLPLPEGALIGGIIRGERVIVPRGTTFLRVGDRLIVISQPESFDEVLRVLTGEEG